MLIRLDARRLDDPAGLPAVLGEAFGLPPDHGTNLDAVVDALTHLDDPRAGATRVQVFPGRTVLLVVDHAAGCGPKAEAQLRALADVVAFVNWRRLEKRQPPVLALAYDRP